MRPFLDLLVDPFQRRALLEAALVGSLGGVVGVHVLVRRLPFFVVAMSHATLPGVVLASMVGVSLLLGGAVFGGVVALLVLVLGRGGGAEETSVVGVVLAGSFALGVLLQSARSGGARELSAFLVGSLLTVTRADVVATAAVGGAVLLALVLLHKELVFSAFDPGAARAVGYRLGVLDAVVLLAVTTALVVAVPAVGTLLAVALLTVPALTARTWTDRIAPAMVLGAAVGVAAGIVGLVVSSAYEVAAGGAVTLAAAALFALSAALQPVRRRLRRSG